MSSGRGAADAMVGVGIFDGGARVREGGPPSVVQGQDAGADGDGSAVAARSDSGPGGQPDAAGCELPVSGPGLEVLAWERRPVLDGNLEEWPAPSFTVLQVPADFVHTPGYVDGDPKPAGADDFGALFAVSWTADALFFAVIVKDDVHHNDVESGFDIYRGDSIQMAFDMARDGTHDSGYDTDDDYEYGWALKQGLAVGARWVAPADTPPPRDNFSVDRDDSTGRTRYEATLAAANLGVSGFAAGDVFGFSFLVNEDDGSDREGWVEWSSGIGLSKDPDSFGTLRLATVPAECEGL